MSDSRDITVVIEDPLAVITLRRPTMDFGRWILA